MNPFSLHDQYLLFLEQAKLDPSTWSPEESKYVKSIFVAGWCSMLDTLGEHMSKVEDGDQFILFNKMLDEVELYWADPSRPDFKAFHWRNK